MAEGLPGFNQRLRDLDLRDLDPEAEAPAFHVVVYLRGGRQAMERPQLLSPFVARISFDWKGRRIMAERRVTRTRKDKDGDITALCSGQNWSPRQKRDAINDIETNTHSYYVQSQSGEKVWVHVVKGQTGKYLRTTADRYSGNNLDDLPDC